MRNEILELQNQLLSITNGFDSANIKEKLQNKTFSYNSKTKTLFELLDSIKSGLADGCHLGYIDKVLTESFGISSEEAGKYPNPIRFSSENKVSDVTGPLIIHQIIEIIPETDNTQQLYFLSEFGKKFVEKYLT